MKTINSDSNQTECTPQSAGCWPESVEESYERLVAAVTAFVSGEPSRNLAAAESIGTLNSFAL